MRARLRIQTSGDTVIASSVYGAGHCAQPITPYLPLSANSGL
jgi:hypothetical protein